MKNTFILQKFVPESEDSCSEGVLNHVLTSNTVNSIEDTIKTSFTGLLSKDKDNYDKNVTVAICDEKELEQARHLEELSKKLEEKYKFKENAQNEVMNEEELEKNQKLVIENWNNHTINTNKSSTKCNDICCNPIVDESGKLYCLLCNFSINNWENHKTSTIHLFNNNKIEIKSHPLFLDMNNKGYEILNRIGWNIDKGLGKEENGRIEPIYTELKNNKSGIGYENDKKKKITHFPSHNEYEKKISEDGLSEGLRSMIQHEESRLKRKMSIFSKRERKRRKEKEKREKENEKKRIKYELIEDFK